MKLPGGKPLEYILAVPGRCYADFDDILHVFQRNARTELIDETVWCGKRLVIAHHPGRAVEQTTLRRQRTAALEARAAELAGKLDCSGRRQGFARQEALRQWRHGAHFL